MNEEKECPQCGSVLTSKERENCIRCLISFGEIDRESIDSEAVVKELLAMTNLFSGDIAAGMVVDTKL